MTEKIRVDITKLRDFAAEVSTKAGMSAEDAGLFADSLAAAEARGIGSHGFTRFSTYIKRIELGLADAAAKPEIVSEMPSFLLLDAKNGMGVPSAMAAMKMCVERAEKTGACFAGVRNGNHFGIAAFFSDYAARHGMIGVAMTNAASAIAPTGGKKAMLGTNPLSVSMPMGEGGVETPFNLDMATSVVARGKVKLAQKEGRSIPEGWAIDADGNPVTDPNKAVTMLPMGGYKGYGLGLVIEAMCSALTGAAFSEDICSFYNFGEGLHQNCGFFVGALNAGALMPAFASSLSEICARIKSSPKAEGAGEIFIPGEIEHRKSEAAYRDGVLLSGVIIDEMKVLAEKYGVPFPKG